MLAMKDMHIHMGRRSNKPVTAREPTGRPQREREFPPAQVRRLREAAMSGLRDQEWGTELGRLFLTDAISAEQYAAGKRWAESAARYRNAIDVRPVRSAALQVGITGHDPDPDSTEGEKLARKERDAMERYYAAHAILINAGMMAERVVRQVCEGNQSMTSQYERQALENGLSTLADHYALTNRRK